MKRFVGDTIRRVSTGMGGCPLSFVWKNREFRVAEVLRQWQDFDYSPLAPKKDWRSRRHRNLFQIRTETNECFELSCDRGTKLDAPRHWILQTVLDDSSRP
jgi:hypothetical protein